VTPTGRPLPDDFAEIMEEHLCVAWVQRCTLLDATFRGSSWAGWVPETLAELEALTPAQVRAFVDDRTSRIALKVHRTTEDRLHGATLRHPHGYHGNGVPRGPRRPPPRPVDVGGPLRRGWAEDARTVLVPVLVDVLELPRRGKRHECPCCRQGGRGTVTTTSRAWHCHHCRAGGDGFALVAACLYGDTDTSGERFQQIGRWFGETIPGAGA